MTTIELTQADDASSLSVHTGDVIVLRLRENPSTAYRWSVDRLPAGATVVDDVSESAGSRPGAAGMRRVAIRVDVPVDDVWSLACSRPWEPAQPAERFEVTLSVS